MVKKNTLFIAFLVLILELIVIFFISPLITSFTGGVFVDPILSKIGPLDVIIEPYNMPYEKEGNNEIRINLRNEGFKTVRNLNAEYKLDCEMDDFKKAQLHKTSLKKDETDFFTFNANLNTSCSISTEPLVMEAYQDPFTKQYYVKIEEKGSQVCMYCRLNIILYEGFNEIGNLTYWYPFSEGELKISGKGVGGIYKNYNLAENKDRLRRDPSRDIKITVIDASQACIRGDIEKGWCDENYPNLFEGNLK